MTPPPAQLGAVFRELQPCASARRLVSLRGEHRVEQRHRRAALHGRHGEAHLERLAGERAEGRVGVAAIRAKQAVLSRARGGAQAHECGDETEAHR